VPGEEAALSDHLARDSARVAAPAVAPAPAQEWAGDLSVWVRVMAPPARGSGAVHLVAAAPSGSAELSYRLDVPSVASAGFRDDQLTRLPFEPYLHATQHASLCKVERRCVINATFTSLLSKMI
jgi:hypothetical protein